MRELKKKEDTQRAVKTVGSIRAASTSFNKMRSTIRKTAFKR